MVDGARVLILPGHGFRLAYELAFSHIDDGLAWVYQVFDLP